MLFSLLFSSASYAALSATTAQTIQGTAPKIGIKGTITEATLDDAVSVLLPNGNKLSPLGVTSVNIGVSAQFDDIMPYITYLIDAEGDVADPILSPAGISGLTFTWKDNSGTVISNLSSNFLLNKSPYTLTVSATNLAARSQYGQPNQSSNYGSQSQIYTFNVIGIKYFKTKSTYQTGGVNATYYDSNLGFNVSKLVAASKTFPTFGFINAEYSLVMSAGLATDYDYKVSIGGIEVANTSIGKTSSVINVDTSGTVTFLAKPTGQVTVSAVDKLSGLGDDYSFTIAKWVVTDNSITRSGPQAVTYCGGESKLFTTAEISTTTSLGVNSQRHLGTLLGEWGKLNDYTSTFDGVIYWIQGTGSFNSAAGFACSGSTAHGQTNTTIHNRRVMYLSGTSNQVRNYQAYGKCMYDSGTHDTKYRGTMCRG